MGLFALANSSVCRSVGFNFGSGLCAGYIGYVDSWMQLIVSVYVRALVQVCSQNRSQIIITSCDLLNSSGIFLHRKQKTMSHSRNFASMQKTLIQHTYHHLTIATNAVGVEVSGMIE